MFIDMKDIPATDLAYAAGVIDSDGCVSVTKGYKTKAGPRSYVVMASVGMKLGDVPEWFLATFGGYVRVIRRNGKWSEGASGITFFPPTIRWEMYGRDAANFLESIVPYLKMKRTRAEAAIKLARMHRKRGDKRDGWSGIPITERDGEKRDELALVIRTENHKSNERVAMTAKWGVN